MPIERLTSEQINHQKYSVHNIVGLQPGAGKLTRRRHNSSLLVDNVVLT